MKPAQSPTDCQKGLFRPQLSTMINLHHELIQLAERLDWEHIDKHLSNLIMSKVGNIALPTRLVAAVFTGNADIYLVHTVHPTVPMLARIIGKA